MEGWLRPSRQHAVKNFSLGQLAALAAKRTRWGRAAIIWGRASGNNVPKGGIAARGRSGWRRQRGPRRCNRRRDTYSRVFLRPRSVVLFGSLFQEPASRGSSAVRPSLSAMGYPARAQKSFPVQARAFSAVWTDCAQPCLDWSYPPRSSDSVGQGTQISCAQTDTQRQALPCGLVFPLRVSHASSQQSCTVSSQWGCNGHGCGGFSC